LEAFICQAFKGEAIVYYCEPLITQKMEASGLPERGKLMRKKDFHTFLPFGYYFWNIKFF
jgi:hypothetical protein